MNIINKGLRSSAEFLSRSAWKMLIVLACMGTHAHAQSVPGEPIWPVVGPLACKPGEVRFEGRCLFPLPPTCKAGQVVFEGRCLTPDRSAALKTICGETATPDIATKLTLAAVVARLVCR